MMRSQQAYETVSTQIDDEGPSPELSESLTRPVQVPRAASAAIIQVTAPATLPEGYVFETSLGDRVIKVTVPPGGVEEGQQFTVPLPTDVESVVNQRIQVPVGSWRDGLCGCCNYGVCHPHCWTACCCTTIATGQVIRRLKLKWNGLTGTSRQASVAFPILLSLACLYYGVRFGLWFTLVFIIPGPDFDEEESSTGEQKPIQPSETWMEVDHFYNFWFWSFWILLAVILYNTRQYVRNRYSIPPEYPFSDAVLACCCPCLAAGQLLRHTTDYEVYPASVFTDRGIPSSAPEIV